MKYLGLLLLLGTSTFNTAQSMEGPTHTVPTESQQAGSSQIQEQILQIYRKVYEYGDTLSAMDKLQKKRETILDLIRKVPENERNDLRAKIYAIYQQALMKTSIAGTKHRQLLVNRFNEYLDDLFASVAHSPRSLQDLAREKVSPEDLEGFPHLKGD